MAGQVRLAGGRDIAQFAAIERSAAELFAGTPVAWLADAPVQPGPALSQAIARGHLWVVEMPGGGLAGFLLASFYANGLFIDELAVHRDFQRLGHGRALVEAAIASARRAGLAAVALMTDRTLDWNRPFYERAGFAIVAECRLPDSLHGKREAELAYGHDMARRCTMILNLKPWQEPP